MADIVNEYGVPIACEVCCVPWNLHEAELHLMRRALELTDGNRTKAAEILGIHVRTLRRRLNGGKR